MAGLGRACLLLALVVCVYGIGASLYGVRKGRIECRDSGRRAVYALAVILTVGYRDPGDRIPAQRLRLQHGRRHLERHDADLLQGRGGVVIAGRLAAPLGLAAVAVVEPSLFLTRKRMREIAPYATAILLGFGGLLHQPDDRLCEPLPRPGPAPAEGVGLDPLLRFPEDGDPSADALLGLHAGHHPAGVRHGRTAGRRVDAEWISAVRRFAFAAWLFLGIGILLGARWSYSELGWGGYWGWDAGRERIPDAVADRDGLPALADDPREAGDVEGLERLARACHGGADADGHLPRAQRRLGLDPRLRRPYPGCAVRLPDRSPDRRVHLPGGDAKTDPAPDHRLDSLLSRESIFLGNNILLVAVCFVIFWGTYFPLISEAVTGHEASVGPPWFDRYTVPLALILVLLSGIGPVIAWRRATLANARRNFLLPLAAASGRRSRRCSARASSTSRGRSPCSACCVCLHLHRPGVLARRPSAARDGSRGRCRWRCVALVQRNRAAMAATSSTSGIAVLFVGVAASSSFQHASRARSQRRVSRPSVGAYTIRYVRPTADDHAEVRTSRTPARR